MVIMIIIIVILMGLGIAITVFNNKSTKDKLIARQRFYNKAYRFLSSFFLTQMKMNKIFTRLSTLSIYDINELHMLSTKYMVITTSVTLGLIISSIILFKDTISVLICIGFALLADNILVNKQVNSVKEKVYRALKYTISSIRQEYLRLNSVPDAIAEADIHPLLKKPFEEIHAILTNTDGELRLLKFYESSPFKPLQTLAGVCYNIHNYGDGRDEYGQSNFIQALTMLSSDINSEIEKFTLIRAKFGKIEYLPFAPLFAIRLIESFFSSIMPGTVLVYNSVLGYIGRVVTILSCIISYVILANINMESNNYTNDSKVWVLRLLQRDWIRKFINDIKPKGLRARKVELMLNSALSKKSIEHLYLEKVVYSIIAFMLALLVVISTISLSRDFILNNTQQLTLIANDDLEKYSKEQILALDKMYLNRDHEWTDEEFKENIQSALPGLTDLQVFDQIKRLKDKEKSLNNAYFHWYYMVGIIIVSCLAWFLPNLMLWVRKFLVSTEDEEDFMQLQTLMAILMNTQMDTLDVLWQMCQHSRIHKDMLLYCYHNYPSNPEKELARLKSKTRLVEFKRFIDKLSLTIRDLSLREAFSDLKIEREHMIRMREINIKATIDKKRGISGPLSMAPILICIAFELLIPIGYLGFRELANIFTSWSM